jgi:hypothetical protein
MPVVHDGQILDGRAAQSAGIDCPLTAYEGDDPYAVSLNLRRRHLDETQRAVVAAKLENLKHGQRADLRDANLHLFDQAPVAPVSRAAAAQLLNVSERSVASARKVVDEGAPELVVAVERGKVSVSAAADVAPARATATRSSALRGVSADSQGNGSRPVSSANTL